MTASAKRILETPMAPYADLLLSMQPQEMRIVVTVLNEALAESEKAQRTAAEKIREKYKKLSISQETKDLVRGLSLSSEEMNDERTQYLLGYKR